LNDLQIALQEDVPDPENDLPEDEADHPEDPREPKSSVIRIRKASLPGS
jgi:hypothetical protein